MVHGGLGQEASDPVRRIYIALPTRAPRRLLRRPHCVQHSQPAHHSMAKIPLKGPAAILIIHPPVARHWPSRPQRLCTGGPYVWLGQGICRLSQVVFQQTRTPSVLYPCSGVYPMPDQRSFINCTVHSGG